MIRTSGPEHRQEAERLLAEATRFVDGRLSAESATAYASLAQAHAMLAQVSLAVAAEDPSSPDAAAWAMTAAVI